MANIIGSLISGGVLLLLSLFFWALVSRYESPLLSLMPYNWSVGSILVCINIAFGIGSLILLHFCFELIYPSIQSKIIYQNLLVLYVPLFGMAYIIGGLHPVSLYLKE